MMVLYENIKINNKKKLLQHMKHITDIIEKCMCKITIEVKFLSKQAMSVKRLCMLREGMI